MLGRCFVSVATAGGTGSYTVTITPGGTPRGAPWLPTWEREPNDQQAQPTIAPDTSSELRGSIASRTDVDWYSARTTGSTTTFYLRQDASVSNFLFSVHYPDGKPIGQWPGETTRGLDIGSVPPRVLIRVWNQYGTTGPYRIYIGST
jgi:hypothetical protein